MFCTLVCFFTVIFVIVVGAKIMERVRYVEAAVLTLERRENELMRSLEHTEAILSFVLEHTEAVLALALGYAEAMRALELEHANVVHGANIAYTAPEGVAPYVYSETGPEQVNEGGQTRTGRGVFWFVLVAVIFVSFVTSLVGLLSSI